MRLNTFIAIVIASVVITGSIVSFPTSAQRFEIIETNIANQDRTDDYQTIVSIPVETGTLSYENLNKTEAVPFGPNSISITAAGNILVGNWVDNTATELSLDGYLVNRIQFTNVTAINDVKNINDRYYALDRTADDTAVVSDIGERTATAKNTFRFSADDKSVEVGEIAVADLEGRERV